MPTKSTDRQYKHTKEYDVQLEIGNFDFSNDLTKLQLISSINNPYLTVAFELFIDPIYVLKYLNSDSKFKLKITGLAERSFDQETFEVDLFFVSSDYQIVIKPTTYINKQEDRVRVKVITVPEKPFSTMTKLVNKIYFDKTISEISEDLAKTFTNAKIEIDTKNANNEKLKQVLIPPTTLYKSFLYLNDFFGYFKGLTDINCDLENKITIKNLSQNINNSFLIIHQLVSDSDNKDVIEKCVDGFNFYTLQEITFKDNSSSILANLAYNTNYIVKPDDTLFKKIEENINDITKNYGILSQQRNNLKIENSSLQRTRFVNSHMGLNETNFFAISDVLKSLSMLSTLKVTIQRNLYNIKNLLSSGSPVKLNPGSIEYTNLSGKYILHSSNILFRKRIEWYVQADLTLCRTVRDL